MRTQPLSCHETPTSTGAGIPRSHMLRFIKHYTSTEIDDFDVILFQIY